MIRQDFFHSYESTQTVSTNRTVGNFYTNITVLGERANEASDVLRELGREAYIIEMPSTSIVYDRECDEQNTEILAALAEHLATNMDAISFAVLNHDDDILWFQLYDRSDLVAEYSNRGGPKTDLRALCRTLGRPQVMANVWWLLHRPFLFQRSRHYRLVNRLGLPQASVGFGFNYINRGETPPGFDVEDIVHVGRV